MSDAEQGANWPARAVFFDGTSNRKREVELRLGETLDIVEGGDVLARWPYDAIRRADGVGPLRLRRAGERVLARLEIHDPQLQEQVIALCPSLNAASAPSHTWRIVGWSLAAVCSIVAVAVFGVPLIADRLAPLVPFAMERRIGEAVDKQVGIVFGDKICNSDEGQAALAVMIDRLKVAGNAVRPFQARVLASQVPNAVALPGGRIYLLDGLLQKAQGPDEIAGVLAHEIGHVEHRDSLRKLIQTGGTSFLIGLLFGDLTGGSAMIFVGRSVLDASYSREAETKADAFATATMHRLGRSARPMGELLVRLTGAKETATILDSHPVSADRLARMTKDDTPAGGPPILDARQWQALKDICKAK